MFGINPVTMILLLVIAAAVYVTMLSLISHEPSYGPMP